MAIWWEAATISNSPTSFAGPPDALSLHVTMARPGVSVARFVFPFPPVHLYLRQLTPIPTMWSSRPRFKTPWGIMSGEAGTWMSDVQAGITPISKVTAPIPRCTGKPIRAPRPLVPGLLPTPGERIGMIRLRPPRVGPHPCKGTGLPSTVNRSSIPRREVLFLSFPTVPPPYPAPCVTTSISGRRSSYNPSPPRRPRISPSRNITPAARIVSLSPTRRGVTRLLMSSSSYAIPGRESWALSLFWTTAGLLPCIFGAVSISGPLPPLTPRMV